MRSRMVAALVACLVVAPAVFAEPPPPLSDADRTAVFRAAGFKQQGDRWIRCEEEPPTASYMPGQIEVVDLNGDGRPEAWVIEGSTFCYGHTGQATVLVTKDANASWRKILDEVGVALTEKTRHQGWPDVTVGGPGFDPVPPHRWNGTRYERTR